MHSICTVIVQGDLVADNQSIDRRQFLSKLTATIGGSVAVAAASSTLVQAQPIQTQTIEQQGPIPESKGYKRTEHVDTYYQLADF